MMCCFTATPVVEPVQIPKPSPSSIGAEVPVTTKPVTLMFRIPSDDIPEKKEDEEDVDSESEDEDEDTCDSQGEEVSVIEREKQSMDSVNNILLLGLTIVILYTISVDAGMNITLPYTL
jgi:hypothetical protein